MPGSINEQFRAVKIALPDGYHLNHPGTSMATCVGLRVGDVVVFPGAPH